MSGKRIPTLVFSVDHTWGPEVEILTAPTKHCIDCDRLSRVKVTYGPGLVAWYCWRHVRERGILNGWN